MFIPGNHDHYTLFHSDKENSQYLTSNAINMHKQVFNVNSSLQIIGFGGSAPSM